MASEQVVATTAALRARVADARADGATVGFVPTMGALHAGHASLIRAAAAECGFVVVSIFVNPTQFAAGEDLDAYPRDLVGDTGTATDAGADLIFAPTVADMYPGGLDASSATWVTVHGPTEGLCAGDRPEHFRGVATVVARLFNKVQPHVAYFGEKDYQQLAVIRRMVLDLDFPVRVRGVPIVREPDGLAMSSRNTYLRPAARAQATSLYRGLLAARGAWRAGERRCSVLVDAVTSEIAAAPLATLQYVELVDPVSLAPVSDPVPPDTAVQLAVAARVDGTRLIDNMRLSP